MPKPDDDVRPIVRPYRSDDRNAVVALWRATRLVVPWNDPDRDIDRKVAEDPSLFLVAEVGNRVVGTAMAGYDGHRGWVYYLAVAPDRQRRGVGRLLMAAAEERLAARGCAKVNLMVRAGNEEALDFYAALGYRRDDVVSLGKRLVADGPVDPYVAAQSCVALVKDTPSRVEGM